MEQKKKKLSVKRLERLLLLGVLAALILVIWSLKGADISENSSRVTELKDGWYYLEQEKRIEVSLPASIKTNQKELTLFYEGLGEQAEGQTITTRGAVYEMKLMVGDEILYEYSDEYFPRNAPMKAKLDCCTVLPMHLEGKVLALTFYGSGEDTYEIQEVYMGTGSDVTNFHYRNEAATMIMVLIMVFLAVVAFAVAIYLRIADMRDCRFANVAVFLLLCGIWCVTDSSIAQHLTHLSPITCVVSFYAFMTFATPMICFLKNTAALSKYKILNWILIAFYANAIGQGILNYFGVFEFIDMLIVTHVLLIFGVTAAAGLVIKEYLESKSREIRVILWAFVMLSAGGLLAILLYWLLKIPYYDVIFECGILVFVSLLLCGIISGITENIQFKTEMLVYQRLAKEDRLTGLKNRMAFEEYLTELQSKAAAFKNVALAFMDLNQLKEVNDSYGHNAGDELLIAAARCIQNTFGAEGNCYRIGGDEFCVIIENPTKTEQEWFEKLDNEIRMYNKSSRYRMSIARGLSYLKDENGMMKTMSNWKYEADLKMYENKGRMKRV